MKKTSPLLRPIAFLSTFLFTLIIAPSAAQGALGNTQSDDVVVAIIDTGADISHKSLKDHLWRNPGELGVDNNGRDKANNGIDDDRNGFIDDVNGWNFVDNSKNLNDSHGHGTHIAGIIADSKTTKIMVIKAFDPRSSGKDVLQASINAIHYAIQMHAQIINYSGGGNQSSPEEESALKLAAKSGILVVAAAGNDRANSDRVGFYPAAYPLSNILSVAAVDETGTLLPSSNYGVQSVKIAAPGLHILSSLPENRYGEMTGTSQATALVTKTAALLYHEFSEKNLRRTPSSMIDRLINTADRVPELEGKLRTPGVLNTLRALHATDNH